MKNFNLNSKKDLDTVLDLMASQIENADNTVENGYIIQLTDAEKLSLHMALQMQSALNGNPNILKILINKAAKMEKIPSNAAKN